MLSMLAINNVTRFVKKYIVQTSIFSTSNIYKICNEYKTGMKLVGKVVLLSLLSPTMPFLFCDIIADKAGP